MNWRRKAKREPRHRRGVPPVPADHDAGLQPDAPAGQGNGTERAGADQERPLRPAARPHRQSAGDPAVLERRLLDPVRPGHQPLPRRHRRRRLGRDAERTGEHGLHLGDGAAVQPHACARRARPLRLRGIQRPRRARHRRMTGGDYSVEVNVSNATSVAQVLGSQISFWGEPGDSRHDPARGWGCIDGGREAPEGESCEIPSPRPTEPLLRLPTSCEGPLTATLTGDSWSGETLEGSATIPALSGCGELHFNPSITVQPEQHTSSTPTGVTIDVRVPQAGLLEDGGPPESDVRDTTVTLPEGLEMSPSAANGLQACSEQQAGFLGVNPRTRQTNSPPRAPRAPKRQSSASCGSGRRCSRTNSRAPFI